MKIITRTVATSSAALLMALALASCAPQAEPVQETLDLDLLLERTSEYQKPIIADGTVTAAEYERALLAQRDCVLEAGAQPGEIYEIGNNELTFDYTVEAANDAARLEVESRTESCIPDYFSEVAALWAYQQLLTPAERDKEQPLVLACLEKADVTGLGADADMSEIAAAMLADEEISAAEQACIDGHRAFFSTWKNARGDEH
ncbi:hypothetical protein ACI3KX_09865 [Microbacterium sp. ZW CA_36]|uniref:hypothetical protein n=1 Tax=Microbacterium sp. ZW CA_36 TaxID=3378078 RepID=UPI003854AEB4